jgi:hypothetical protein
MTRKPSLELCDGPTSQRRQHTPFTRDVLTPLGAPIIARHRARTILTPVSVRRAILEDIAAKPEAVRVRSLRRRLTALDRALSDREAEMLDRLTACVNGLSNVGCVNYLKSEVRSSPYGRLPFSERKRREIAAMIYVLKGLSFANRSAILELTALLDPSYSPGTFKPSNDFIASIRLAAGAVVSLYEDHSRRETSTRWNNSRIPSPRGNVGT